MDLKSRQERGMSKGKARRRELLVAPREAGQRLDLFLVNNLQATSRKQAKRLIDSHLVAVNGRIEPMASRALAAGEKVVVSLPDAVSEKPPPRLAVLFEDGDLLAVAKPAGLPSGPTRDPRRLHAQKLAEEGSGRSLTLLHRLDKDTSGVLLLAKTRSAAAGLLTAFRERSLDKTYLALVKGHSQPAFDVSCYLREGSGGKMLVVFSGGVKSETSFRTLASKGGFSLVEAHPRTGRTHQIRVHLARENHPILGDALYGGDAEADGEAVPRQMLHAWALEFPHPSRGALVRVEAPLPEDFQRLAESLLGGPLRLDRPKASPARGPAPHRPGAPKVTARSPRGTARSK